VLLLDLDHEPAVVRPEVAVGREASRWRSRVSKAGPVQADQIGLGGEPSEHLEVILHDRPQPKGKRAHFTPPLGTQDQIDP
jgi:hypothetical protein